MNYIDSIAQQVRARLSDADVPDGDTTDLFRIYAILVLTVGASTTKRDVHNAWCAWIAESQPNHESLVPFDQLDDETQDQDEPFVEAIRSVAKDIALPAGEGAVERALFHDFDETNENEVEQRFEQYKLIVDSSEKLVARRQGVNTFFLTANGAVLTAIGLLIRGAGLVSLKAVGVAFLAFAAMVLCYAWASLLTSFGQLNTGKFKVINRIERTLPLGIYSAEWEALERGENPKVYRSFTNREGWVPRLLGGLFVGVTVVAIFVALIAWEWQTPGSPAPGSPPASPVLTR